MNRFVCALLCVVSYAAGAGAQTGASEPSSARPLRPVHTFSIVARDPVTGDMGVAVQSHSFAVGADVTWGEAGVRVVATQSFVDPGYGPRGPALMRSGKTANEALRGLLAADDFADVRQVAMVDAEGHVAAHTGAKCIAFAGNQVGANYSTEANIMANANVWPAMGKAFEAAAGDLTDRLIAAGSGAGSRRRYSRQAVSSDLNRARKIDQAAVGGQGGGPASG